MAREQRLHLRGLCSCEKHPGQKQKDTGERVAGPWLLMWDYQAARETDKGQMKKKILRMSDLSFNFILL